MAIWLTILASWPEPLGPSSVTACANAPATGAIVSKVACVPPHITVSMPFTAPAWPPDTGASMKPRPFEAASAASSRAMSADAVVWSTKIAPAFMPAKAPEMPSPTTTERRSSSLPTQANTMSAPAAAAAGVAADAPPYSATHCAAFAAVRL